MRIGERVHALLRESGKSQAGLAEHIGSSTSTINGWKKENRNPSSDLLIPICEYLGVSLEYLLTGHDNPTDDQKEQLTPDQKKTLLYYDRLNEENQDYIKGEMVRLYKQQEFSEGGASKELSSTLDDTRKHA